MLHSHANILSPQLKNLQARRARIDIVLSPKLPYSNRISPSFWRTIREHVSSAPIELWATNPSKGAPGSTKSWLRLKYFKMTWNGVTVQRRPSIEGRISFPGSPYSWHLKTPKNGGLRPSQPNFIRLYRSPFSQFGVQNMWSVLYTGPVIPKSGKTDPAVLERSRWWQIKAVLTHRRLDTVSRTQKWAKFRHL